MQGLVDGKIAVITGAGSGVGRAASLLFSRHGAMVVAADIDRVSAEETAAQVMAEGGRARAVQCDVADEASVEAAVRLAVDVFGRLDIIYNNAGITIEPTPGKTRPSLLLETSPEQIARMQGINVGGVLNGCRAAIRQFEKQGGGGAIVNTSSVAGLIGWGGVVYGATKGAVTMITRALALEVAAQGIRVNSVCPAGMLTKFAGMGKYGPLSDEAKQRIAAQHPLGRTIDPLECANAALFLASDLASNITGVNLPVDGGLSAGVPPRR
jgi:NAD(P)-dependent dehydrogenase (short-subunit alcohol dehydrogenase family)